MTTNIGHAEEAWLNAETLITEWMLKFIREWYRPVAEMQLGLLLRTLPDEVKVQLEAMNPEAYQALMKSYVGGG